MIIKSFTSFSPEDTEKAAAEFAKTVDKNSFIALYGDLGAGKTAFVRGLCSVLTPDEAVCSPTYALVNEYSSDNCKVYHFDMYRISGEDDLFSCGFYDYDDGIIVCEWSENIPFALPEHYYKVDISKKEKENERFITIEEINETACN